jgi:hypothetical protein
LIELIVLWDNGILLFLQVWIAVTEKVGWDRNVPLSNHDRFSDLSRRSFPPSNMIHTLGVLKPVNRYELHKILPCWYLQVKWQNIKTLDCLLGYRKKINQLCHLNAWTFDLSCGKVLLRTLKILLSGTAQQLRLFSFVSWRIVPENQDKSIGSEGPPNRMAKGSG